MSDEAKSLLIAILDAQVDALGKGHPDALKLRTMINDLLAII
jgi:hypothetical protein